MIDAKDRKDHEDHDLMVKEPDLNVVQPKHAPGEPSPVPTLKELRPASVVVDDPPFELTVVGDHFNENCMITIARVNKQTKYIDDNNISTIVDPANMGMPYTTIVTVKKGSLESESLPFTFLPPLTEEQKAAKKKAEDEKAKGDMAPPKPFRAKPGDAASPTFAEATREVEHEKAEHDKAEHDPHTKNNTSHTKGRR